MFVFFCDRFYFPNTKTMAYNNPWNDIHFDRLGYAESLGFESAEQMLEAFGPESEEQMMAMDAAHENRQGARIDYDDEVKTMEYEPGAEVYDDEVRTMD